MAHKIRHALTTDHDVIAEINTLAFGKPDEAGLVARLRVDGDALLEMVADDADAVDGHILFSRLWAGNGRLYAALAPMAVRPGLQRDGLGSALVRAGLDGIRRGLNCPPGITEDPAEMTPAARSAAGVRPLPPSLGVALDGLLADQIACSWFDEDLLSTYLAIKRWEIGMVQQVGEDEAFRRYRTAY